MKSFRSIGVTLLALSMGSGGIASAQERDHGLSGRNDRQAEWRAGPDRSERNQRDDRARRWDNNRDQRNGVRQHVEPDSGRGNHAYNQRGGYREQRNEWRGVGPSHDLRRDTYLAPQYRGRQFVVENWQGHHLNAPPRGYQWVQTGGNYVLAAITTGLILQILLNN